MIIGGCIAISIHWGVPFVGVLLLRALLFGIYTRALIAGNSDVPASEKALPGRSGTSATREQADVIEPNTTQRLPCRFMVHT